MMQKRILFHKDQGKESFNRKEEGIGGKYRAKSQTMTSHTGLIGQ
jgi:hypothetical protein